MGYCLVRWISFLATVLTQQLRRVLACGVATAITPCNVQRHATRIFRGIDVSVVGQQQFYNVLWAILRRKL